MMLLPKKLMVDTDAGELVRVKQILDKNRIPYSVKTTLSDNVLSRNFNSRAALEHRTAYSAMDSQSYLYHLYVPVREYTRARALVYGK